MINKVFVFIGSKKDFEKLLKKEISESEDTITFMQLIQQYNYKLRPNDTGTKEIAFGKSIHVNNCIVRADDYGSVLEHVLSNFATIIMLNHDIDKLFVHNPPKKVLNSLQNNCRNIIYQNSKYRKINRSKLKSVYKTFNSEILGQERGKIQIISGIYRLINKSSKKPIVLMLYGPSGVGKTETAKVISKCMGGNLLRIQFSMMQTIEASNYIFGAEHSKPSFARDMLARESNVILIDEFDKVSPSFYNAFYELFDEGVYEDVNYQVYLKNSIFILTSNFKNEEEIKNTLGPAMFSRVGCCIEYEDLKVEDKRSIVKSYYSSILDSLTKDEKKIIDESNILKWFLDNADRYDNIRSLKIKLENAIFDKLTEILIINDV